MMVPCQLWSSYETSPTAVVSPVLGRDVASLAGIPPHQCFGVAQQARIFLGSNGARRGTAPLKLLWPHLHSCFAGIKNMLWRMLDCNSGALLLEFLRQESWSNIEKDTIHKTKWFRGWLDCTRETEFPASETNLGSKDHVIVVQLQVGYQKK